MNLCFTDLTDLVDLFKKTSPSGCPISYLHTANKQPTYRYRFTNLLFSIHRHAGAGEPRSLQPRALARAGRGGRVHAGGRVARAGPLQHPRAAAGRAAHRRGVAPAHAARPAARSARPRLRPHRPPPFT